MGPVNGRRALLVLLAVCAVFGVSYAAGNASESDGKSESASAPADPKPRAVRLAGTEALPPLRRAVRRRARRTAPAPAPVRVRVAPRPRRVVRRAAPRRAAPRRVTRAPAPAPAPAPRPRPAPPPVSFDDSG